ncbi:helix-turn-helix transcriptional regulator [Holophaga foetida]|uniref:helix-turn-helix transcriptional regulator n=1 Tax=Holophaga foetida TaxID=35839 RepID=UPI0002474D2E|nr:WYL domain-containing protein [Holophaga foetida]
MAPRRSTKKTSTPEPATESPVVEATPVEETPAPKARKAPARPRKSAKKELEEAVEAAVAAPVTDLALPAHAQILLGAIQGGNAVELLFLDAETNPPRTFEPRQLSFEALNQAWFVWGWDRRYNAERHHRLDLLAEVNVVEGVGRSAQGPYKEGVAANQIGGWLGGEPIQVKATLLKQWIFAVKQAPTPFPEFTIQDQEEGKALVSFTATDLRAIARWCMQFGDGLQVLEPQRLVDRVKQVGVHWGGKAAQAAPAPKAPPAPRPERAAEPRRSEHPARRENSESPRREAPEPRREAVESAPPKSKPGKVEVRIERL